MEPQRHMAVVLGALLGLPGLAGAEECRQEFAVYAEPEAGFELSFKPVKSDAAATSHLFDISVPKTKVVLDGNVMVTDEVSRTEGVVFYNCPEGDVTGADIRACTVWEGVIYAVDDSGNVDLLPPEGADAAGQLLLPGFGLALRFSSAWGADKASVAPWDVFKLKGCANG
jgi:hypothetical protein